MSSSPAVAATGPPMLSPAGVFSSTSLVVVSSANSGATGFSYDLPIGPLPRSSGVFGVYCILANTMAGNALSTRTGATLSLAAVPQTSFRGF